MTCMDALICMALVAALWGWSFLWIAREGYRAGFRSGVDFLNGDIPLPHWILTDRNAIKKDTSE